MKYFVDLNQDENGIYIAVVKNIQGVHSNGSSPEEAVARAKEALSLVIDVSDVELVIQDK
jgi:predicted RNase H-like HicB family nuclease